MPGEPLILAAGLAAHPGLFEVARKDDAQRCGAYPGGDHESTVQAHQQLAGAAHILYDGQIDGIARRQAANIVIANAVLLQAAARGDEHMVDAVLQIKAASLHHSDWIALHLAIDDAIHQRGVQQTRRVLWLQRWKSGQLTSPNPHQKRNCTYHIGPDGAKGTGRGVGGVEIHASIFGHTFRGQILAHLGIVRQTKGHVRGIGAYLGISYINELCRRLGICLPLPDCSSNS